MSMMCHRSFLSRPDVVSCGQKVVERVENTTSILGLRRRITAMKLLDDLEISTARRSPREPYHFHKLLDVAAEMGIMPGRL
jgi:hypothetical protein